MELTPQSAMDHQQTENASGPHQKRKIAFVCNPKMGGSGIIATELAMALAERGHHIWLLAERHPYSWRQVSDTLHFLKLHVNDYPVFESAPHTLALAGALANLVEQNGIEIVHAHYAVPYAAAGLMAKFICKKPFKLMTTLHGTDVVKLADDPAMHRVIETVLAESERVISVSDDLAQQTFDRFDLKQTPATIANFVVPKKIFQGNRADARKELGLDVDETYLVHASNFREIKRIPDIVRCFALVRKQMKCKMIFLGEGPEVEPSKALARSLGVFDDITWVGQDPLISRWFSAANVNLQLSEYESFGLTLIESMIQGTPSVVTNIGGMPEVVKDVGKIVEVGDYEAAANAALELLNDEESEHIKKLCLEVASSRYSSEAVCIAYEKVYDQALCTKCKSEEVAASI